MSKLGNLLRALRADTLGAAAIETAIAAPVLAALSVGGFEVSRAVARQTELQSAAGVAQSIALAAAPTTQAKIDTLKQVIVASTGLSADKVSISNSYRCGTAATLTLDKTTCAATDVVSTYVVMTLTDTYTPMWSKFGMGKPINYNITRRMQVA